MITYQDFLKLGTPAEAVATVIKYHLASEEYKIACIADEYDRQRNTTIMKFAKMMYRANGAFYTAEKKETGSNHRIASNFFARLNTQRCTYSLGNGVTFTQIEEIVNEEGRRTRTDTTKQKLGNDFDTVLWNAGYYALIHRVSFIFWNYDHAHVYKLTEFAPIWDEDTGVLRAGVRFWRLDSEHPMIAVLYEEDGYTKFKAEDGTEFVKIEEKRGYIQKIESMQAADDAVIGEENYSAMPIIPFWGSKRRQSTLVGMRESIDAYDLIKSGFVDDVNDCAEIFWLVENYGGMSDKDLQNMLEKMNHMHIVEADTSQGGKITPYTQEVPYQARQQILDSLRSGIYEDFGGLDVHTIAAGSTNDHIDAAYQPLDENADDFEYNTIECVRGILRLIGVDDVPQFKRNRISNQKEQVDMVAVEAQWLDDRTILALLPNVTPDQIDDILDARLKDDDSRFVLGGMNDQEDEENAAESESEDENIENE